MLITLQCFVLYFRVVMCTALSFALSRLLRLCVRYGRYKGLTAVRNIFSIIFVSYSTQSTHLRFFVLVCLVRSSEDTILPTCEQLYWAFGSLAMTSTRVYNVIEIGRWQV